MEKQLNFQEWFLQSDYDLETAMDKRPFIADKEKAHEIIAYMHTVLHRHGVPCNIALFGSFLHGNYHAESDLDIIIISEKFEGKGLLERLDLTMRAEEEVRVKYRVPMDVLKKSPQEYNDHNRKMFESKIII